MDYLIDTLKSLLEGFDDTYSEAIAFNTVLIDYLSKAKLSPKSQISFTYWDFENDVLNKARQANLKIKIDFKDMQEFLFNNLSELEIDRRHCFKYEYDKKSKKFSVYVI